MRAPRQLSEVQTRAQALQYLKHSFSEQLAASIEQNVEANTEILGDRSARQGFRLLLYPTEQRAFFQGVVRDVRYWPRVKSLFGNPPYTFLLPQDDGLLRAGGICRNRANLAAIDSSVSKAADFGHGHFYDDHGRVYKVIANQASHTELPWRGLVVHTKLIVDVRLKNMTHKAKMEVLSGPVAVAKSALMFPRPGEDMRLHLSSALQGYTESSESVDSADNGVRVRVVSGQQKAKLSPIARLVVLVMSK